MIFMKQMIELTNEQRNVLKNTQLELLDEFKNFCDTHNLRFYLFGGTLLGAIRNNGFIPWDDDIDVCMPRDDYNKFLEFYKENDKYFLQSTQTDKYYFYHFVKLTKKNTVYDEFMTQHLKTKKGIFIDIFPINGYPEKIISKFHYNFWLFLLNKKSYPLNFIKTKKIKRNCLYILMTILSWVLLWWAPYHLCAKMRNNFMKRHQYTKSNKVIVGTNLRKIYNRDFFVGITSIIFEGRIMYGMGDVTKYLTKMYGDYMELPPEAERIPHHYLVDFKG